MTEDFEPHFPACRHCHFKPDCSDPCNKVAKSQADQPKNSHFKTVGWLIPTNNRKSFRVMVEIEGKPIVVGLIQKEALLRSLNSRSMRTVEISKFTDRPNMERTVTTSIGAE